MIGCYLEYGAPMVRKSVPSPSIKYRCLFTKQKSGLFPKELVLESVRSENSSTCLHSEFRMPNHIRMLMQTDKSWEMLGLWNDYLLLWELDRESRAECLSLKVKSYTRAPMHGSRTTLIISASSSRSWWAGGRKWMQCAHSSITY
jgi:hypothetical protein